MEEGSEGGKQSRLRIKRGELSKSDNVGTHSPLFLLSSHSPLPFNPVTLSHASMGEGGGGSPRDEIETAPAIVGLFMLLVRRLWPREEEA